MLWAHLCSQMWHVLAGAGLPPGTVLLHYLVAACDPSESVARCIWGWQAAHALGTVWAHALVPRHTLARRRRGDDLLRRHCGTEGPRPAVDLEGDPALLAALFGLFHGHNPAMPGADGTPEGKRAQPASAAGRLRFDTAGLQIKLRHMRDCGLLPVGPVPAVRSRILGLLCRSVAAASLFPQTILTIEEAVYGKVQDYTLIQAGLPVACPGLQGCEQGSDGACMA